MQAKKYITMQTLFLKIQNLLLYKVKTRGYHMKTLNLIIKIVIITTILQENLVPGFAGRAAQRQSNATQTAVNLGITESFKGGAAGGTTGCCPTGQTCQTVAAGTSYIPSFTVYILGKEQNALNLTWNSYIAR